MLQNGYLLVSITMPEDFDLNYYYSTLIKSRERQELVTMPQNRNVFYGDILTNMVDFMGSLCHLPGIDTEGTA